MGRKCFAPNCNTGYQSCKEKVSTFSAPKDDVLRSKWNAAIPRSDRSITVKDCICAKHFQQTDIIKEWIAVDPKTEQVLMKVDLKHARLKDGAIPSLFPNCPSYCSKQVKVRKRPMDRSNLPTYSKKAKTLLNQETNRAASAVLSTLDIVEHTMNQEMNGLESETSSTLDIVEHTMNQEMNGLESETSSTLDNVENTERTLFNALWEDHTTLPPVLWAIHRINDQGIPNMLCASNMSLQNHSPVLFKQICVDISCNVSYIFISKPVSIELLKAFPNLPLHISSPDVFQDCIREFDKTNTCSGGPPIKAFQNINPQCARHDVTGKWRHIKCDLLLKNGIHTCKKCYTLWSTFKSNKTRNEKPLKRLQVKLPTTPSKLYAFKNLQKAKRLQGFILNNAKKKISMLQARVATVKSTLKA